MLALPRLPLLVSLGFCAFVGGCASTSASRDNVASGSGSHTSLRSPALSQGEDATASRSAARPADMVWRQGMEVQWSVQSPTAPANRSMAGRAIVGPDGTIELGPYGTVHVAGLTDHQAKTAVANHLSAYVTDAQVTVIPVAFTARTNSSTPGQYAVSQTAWQSYQPSGEASETAPTEVQQAPPPARSLGQRLLGFWKGS